jgi:hypothetical protein
VIDADGRPVSWISRRDARILRGRSVGSVMTVENPQRWLDDPYVAFVAQLTHEQGLLVGDMSPVRQWCLRGHVVRRDRRRHEEIENQLLAQMSFTAPEAYLQLQERRRQEEWAKEEQGIQWRAPESPEELAEIMTELEEIFGPDMAGQNDDGWDDEGSPSYEGPDYSEYYRGMS